MDPAPIVAAVQQALAAVALIGTAVVIIIATIAMWRWVRLTVDAPVEQDDIEDADDVSAFYEQGGALACENCDYELDEDAALSALDHGYCPKCGHEVSY